MEQLSEIESAVLKFEGRTFRNAGVKEELIRSTFGWQAARYYQVVQSVIKKPAALAQDPQLVGRLIDQRDRRLEARLAGAFSD